MKRLVKVLAVKNEHAIVIEQYRKRLNKNTIELPGGKIEHGETPVEAAKRELREETGVVSNEFIHLGTYIDSARTVEVNLFFTNTIEKIEKQDLDNDEYIEVQKHPLHHMLDNISTNKWEDTRLGMAYIVARGMGLIQ